MMLSLNVCIWFGVFPQSSFMIRHSVVICLLLFSPPISSPWRLEFGGKILVFWVPIYSCFFPFLPCFISSGAYITHTCHYSLVFFGELLGVFVPRPLSSITQPEEALWGVGGEWSSEAPNFLVGSVILILKLSLLVYFLISGTCDSKKSKFFLKEFP